MKAAILSAVLVAASFAASAAGAVHDGNALPFNIHDGRNIQANLPPMKHIKDYFETRVGATFKSDIPCTASSRGRVIHSDQHGVKLFALRNGEYGSWVGCARKNGLGHDIVIWEDGSDSFILKETWEGFIPMYMK